MNNTFGQGEEAGEILKRNLEYALSGDSDCCDLYGIEKQIADLNEQNETTMSMMMKTGGDTAIYIEEIKRKTEQIVFLRKRADELKNKVSGASYVQQVDETIEKIKQQGIGFSEFDDVTIRRLIECIRVMKDRRIIITFKGGFQTEEIF